LSAAPQITYAAPAMQTYAAPAPQITYAAPIMQAAPAIEYVSAAPQYVTAAPAVQYVNTVAAPAVEIDQVNAFGQVVERDFVQAAPAVEYVTAAPQYVSAAPVIAAPMAGSPNILGTMVAAPLQLTTTAFQANLPSPYTMLPEYVAPQTFAAPGISESQAAQLGLAMPTTASMIAYPGMSAIQGPFAFTAGAAYAGAPEKILASAPKAEKAPEAQKAPTASAPKAEKAPEAEKAPTKKVTKGKKAKKACC